MQTLRIALEYFGYGIPGLAYRRSNGGLPVAMELPLSL
jgi:hypothetical protein